MGTAPSGRLPPGPWPPTFYQPNYSEGTHIAPRQPSTRWLKVLCEVLVTKKSLKTGEAMITEKLRMLAKRH